MEIIKLTEENFEEMVLKSKKTFLIDFYADWCGPCKMIAPILESFSKNSDKNMVIGKVNVDKESSIAAEYGIFSIPTLMIIKEGIVIKKEPGFKTLDELDKFTNV